MNVLSVFQCDNKIDTGLKCLDKSMTQQNHSAECDINNIIKRYEQTGLVTHVSEKVAQYGDFTEVGDYQTALNLVNMAEDMFMAMPAFVRERFGNDPAQLVAFVQDPQNREEAAKLGLLAVVPAPVEVPPSPAISTPPKGA